MVSIQRSGPVVKVSAAFGIGLPVWSLPPTVYLTFHTRFRLLLSSFLYLVLKASMWSLRTVALSGTLPRALEFFSVS